MPTHAELSSKLLGDAADFFRNLGEQNEALNDQMQENAKIFDQMSQLIGNDPKGDINGTPHAEMTGKLLKDAAGFFRTLAEQNEPIKEQMEENAKVYEQMGELVNQNPEGEIE